MNKDLVIGSYDYETDEYERGFTSQGEVYKNYRCFIEGNGTCYIPELYDTRYTREDFLRIADNNITVAEYLFETVDWQSPEVLMEELLEDKDFLVELGYDFN